MRVLDLFSGIGGFSLGLERAGMETVAFCEIDPYCRKVLAKHWPGVPIHDDITTLDAGDIGPVDVICGGFPCQPFSRAAHGQYTAPDLWPHMLRLIETVRPLWVLAENVLGIGADGIDRVCDDLERADYTATALCMDTALPERQLARHRALFLAHANGNGEPWRPIDAQAPGIQEAARPTWPANPCPMGVADGVSGRVDRLRGLGNAVVPQIPELIGRAIMGAG